MTSPFRWRRCVTRPTAVLAPLTACLCLAAFTMQAASTRIWEISEFRDFAPGKFENLSLTAEGRLTLGPALESAYATDQAVIWDSETGPDGSIYVATGHQGYLYKIDGKGQGKLFWDAPEIEIFSIAVAPSGDVYAATSPKGKIYRITPQGEASEFFNPKETYIWSLLFDKGSDAKNKFGGPGALFAGTGENGKVFRIDPEGRGEVYFDTEQRHVMSLALDPQGRLLAGTDPNGILYRIEQKEKAFALYDADLPELRSLQVAPNGDIYAAVMGGGLSDGGQTVPSAVTSLGSTAVTTITVSATADDPAPDDFQKTSPPAVSNSITAPLTPTPQPVISYSGLEKSALLRVRPGVSVEKLWGSQEENILAVGLTPGPHPELLFATDAGGRIYRLEGERQVSLVTQAEQDQITNLTTTSTGVLLSTAHSGKLYRLGTTPKQGSYQTSVYDASNISKWGRLSWRGESPKGTAVRFQTRTGNSGRPDSTWSDWSDAMQPGEGSDGEPILSPAARYIQWKALLSGNGGEPVTIDRVRLTYLPQNAPPVVHSVEVSTAAATKDSSASGSSGTDTSASYSVTVSAAGNVTNSGGSPDTQALGGEGRQVITISWQADDPDNDPLMAQVQFRGEEESTWKLLKDDVRENKVEIDSDSLADGTYQFQVTVSDQRVNPPGIAKTTQRASRMVLVDHTPPAVKAVAVNGRESVRFEASDAASLLQQAEYSLDAGAWHPVYADDGILDSRSESFTIQLTNLAAGEHLITLRVRDQAGNAGLGKAVIR